MRLICMALLGMSGCARPVPEHLRVDRADPSGMPDVPVSDVAGALAAMIGADPLARSPRLLPDALLSQVADTEPLEAFNRVVRSLERGEGVLERSMQQLEDEWRTSAVVALSRGYRLRVAENQLSRTLQNPETAQEALAAVLTPLRLGAADDTAPRTAMAWLADPPTPRLVRAYADRWVLEGWLTSPSIPHRILAEPLRAPQYDDLRETPLGELLLARAEGRRSGRPEAGLAQLTRATRLALQQAAADRDREQAAWADVKAAAVAELGVDDPIAGLLETARRDLTQAAGDDRAAGGALLAFSAQRWTGTCPQAPCRGLERVESMSSAARWHADLVPLVAIWRVVALKESLDTLEVGRDTALFAPGMVDLVDALLGTGSGPLEVGILRLQRPAPAVWLALSRSVGGDDVVDWEGAYAAVGRHLQVEATRALQLVADEEMQGHLERIRRRAIP